MSKKRFLYDALPDRSIRLITLLPGLPENDLECTIETASLDLNPEYEAVSYVWGVSDRPGYVLCKNPPIGSDFSRGLSGISRPRAGAVESNGSDTFITISPNLESGLRRMRRRDRRVVLWIDQICIDQANIPERSAQVNMMGDIFRKAEQVIMWLGPDDSPVPQARLAAHFVAHLGRIDKPTWRGDVLLTDDQMAEHALPSVSAPEWKALDTLASLQYWQRVWILQEILLASKRRIIWGDATMTWEDVKGAMAYVLSNQQLTFSLMEAGSATALRSSIWNDLVMPEIGSLWASIQRASFRQATDARDRVYGVMGLHNQPMKADYSKSLRDVYVDLAMLFQYDTKDLSVLSQAGIEHLEADWGWPDWPSWVPQWRHEEILRIGSGPFSADGKVTAPSLIIPGGQLRQGQSSHLLAGGIIVDRIAHVAQLDMNARMDRVHGDSVMNQLFIRMQDAWNLCKNHGRPSDPSQPLIRSLLNAAVCGMYNPNRNPAIRSSVWNDTLYAEFAKQWAVFCKNEVMMGYVSPNLQELLNKLEMADAALIGWEHKHTPDQIIGDTNFKTAVRECKELWWSDVSNTQSADYEENMRNIEVGRDHLRAPFLDPQDAEEATWALEPLLNLPCDYSHFYQRFLQSTISRRFFTTSDGTIGIGPQCAREGDLIVIVLGAHVPLILRPLGPNPDCSYQLLGESYLEGIMHGEHIRRLNPAGQPLVIDQWFSIV